MKDLLKPRSHRSLSLACATLSALLPTSVYAQTLGSCYSDNRAGTCRVIGANNCAVGNGSPGTGAGNCRGGENGECWCYAPSYNLSLTPLTPSPVQPGGTVSTTVTITPLGASDLGFLGNVSISCPSPFTPVNTPVTVSVPNASPVSQQISISVPATGVDARSYPLTCTAADSSPNPAPANGPQTVPLVVTNGGGSIALLTFLTLLSVRIAVQGRRRKRQQV